jgi:hypothetical protein
MTRLLVSIALITLVVCQKVADDGDTHAKHHTPAHGKHTSTATDAPKKNHDKHTPTPAPQKQTKKKEQNSPRQIHFMLILGSLLVIGAVFFVCRQRSSAAADGPTMTPMPDFSTPAKTVLSASV